MAMDEATYLNSNNYRQERMFFSFEHFLIPLENKFSFENNSVPEKFFLTASRFKNNQFSSRAMEY